MSPPSTCADGKLLTMREGTPTARSTASQIAECPVGKARNNIRVSCCYMVPGTRPRLVCLANVAIPAIKRRSFEEKKKKEEKGTKEDECWCRHGVPTPICRSFGGLSSWLATCNRRGVCHAATIAAVIPLGSRTETSTRNFRGVIRWKLRGHFLGRSKHTSRTRVSGTLIATKVMSEAVYKEVFRGYQQFHRCSANTICRIIQ